MPIIFSSFSGNTDATAMSSTIGQMDMQSVLGQTGVQQQLVQPAMSAVSLFQPQHGTSATSAVTSQM